jgi:hypothetical protein
MKNMGQAKSDKSIPPSQNGLYFKVLSAADTDQIVVEDKASRQLVFKLAGVLPFSKWPVENAVPIKHILIKASVLWKSGLLIKAFFRAGDRRIRIQ